MSRACVTHLHTLHLHTWARAWRCPCPAQYLLEEVMEQKGKEGAEQVKGAQ